MNDDEDEKQGSDPIRLGKIYGGIAIAVWIATPFLVKWQYPLIGERGQFGDLFGSINALFSGLAFVGVIVAILLQKQELGLQRRELRDSRVEMKRTADAQEAAELALKKTQWAQSYKVVLDILQERTVVEAREAVWLSRDIIRRQPAEGWPIGLVKQAELVSRTFESVGTMVRKELVPMDYIIDTWSMPIAKQWRVLEAHNMMLRDDWGDPFLSQDFKHLFDAADKFLKANGVTTIKYL
jgi:hypothetical protein